MSTNAQGPTKRCWRRFASAIEDDAKQTPELSSSSLDHGSYQIFLRAILAFVFAIFSFICMQLEQSASAEDLLRRSDSNYIRQVQLIETERLDVSAPAGLAYSPEANAFLVCDAPRGRFSGSLDVVMISHFGEAIGSVRITGSPENATGIVFDPRSQRLLTFDPGANELIEVPASRKGTPKSGPLKRTDTISLGLWTRRAWRSTH